ncbi:hypothetical protein PR048_015695 [Dryococelus australis]|uniref:MADF domain-containing protein n=1 Tax=Dryococelus australis TaxID=614101 RepID=A0ABQ9HHZ6_9NEOP|nr:hypothetical protein PR048_015695 [Dryococelus australis]
MTSQRRLPQMVVRGLLEEQSHCRDDGLRRGCVRGSELGLGVTSSSFATSAGQIENGSPCGLLLCMCCSGSHSTFITEYRIALGKQVIKKWKNIKEQWMKCAKKIKEPDKSGSGVKTTKKYIYNEQLSFLKKTINMRDTVSSFDNHLEMPCIGPYDNYIHIADNRDEVETSVKATAGASSDSTESTRAAKRSKLDIEKQILECLPTEDRHLIGESVRTRTSARARFLPARVKEILDVFKCRIRQSPCSYLETNPHRFGRKAVQCWDAEIGCEQPARSIYPILTVCSIQVEALGESGTGAPLRCRARGNAPADWCGAGYVIDLLPQMDVVDNQSLHDSSDSDEVVQLAPQRVKLRLRVATAAQLLDALAPDQLRPPPMGSLATELLRPHYWVLYRLISCGPTIGFSSH